MNFVAVARRDAGLVREASHAQLLTIVRAAFGERSRLLAHRRLDGGHFNTNYLLQCAGEPPVVLRLAPERAAKVWRHERCLLQRQCSVQSTLEAAVGGVVPRLLHADFTQQLLPRDWALFEWRPGQTWESAAAAIDVSSASRLWREYGGLVRELHAQRGSSFGYPAPLGGCAGYGAWFTRIIDDLAADLAEQQIEIVGLPRFQQRLRDERHRFDAVTEPRFVHGDLWTRNVLVEHEEGGWRVTALLDAERAFFGDPAAEWIFGFLDIPQAFWEGYGRSLAEHSLDRDALWRRRACQARGALFMMLEGVRHGFDAGFAHRQFARFGAAMEPDAAPKSDTGPKFDAVPGLRRNGRQQSATGVANHA